MRRRGTQPHIITRDESWIHCYDPESRRSSSQWITQGSCRPTKCRLERSVRKIMLVLFFDKYGVVHKEFVPAGQGIGKELYLQILKRLRKSVRRKRPIQWKERSWGIHHDNAPAHTATIVRNWLIEKHISVVPHPGHSPDLSPCDFWIFNRIKKFIKGQRFHNLQEAQRAVEETIKTLPAEEFAHAMDVSYPDRLRKCVRAQGDYFL